MAAIFWGIHLVQSQDISFFILGSKQRSCLRTTCLTPTSLEKAQDQHSLSHSSSHCIVDAQSGSVLGVAALRFPRSKAAFSTGRQGSCLSWKQAHGPLLSAPGAPWAHLGLRPVHPARPRLFDLSELPAGSPVQSPRAAK